MSTHTALIRWQLVGDGFRKGTYSREHTWTFDGGATVLASPSPANVRPPYSNPAHVDPEEAFVASLSSCHMLWFLQLASRAGFEISTYEDEAVGTMAKNQRGEAWVSRVELRPRIAYVAGAAPTAAQEAELHERAHGQCFIANSVKSEVTVTRPPENGGVA